MPKSSAVGRPEKLKPDEKQLVTKVNEWCPEIPILYELTGVHHPIPTDLEAVTALSDAPAVLDALHVARLCCIVAKGEERIPLFGNLGLAYQIDTVEYSGTRRFRAMLARLSTIRGLLPSCPAVIALDGQFKIVNHGKAIRSSTIATH